VSCGLLLHTHRAAVFNGQESTWSVTRFYALVDLVIVTSRMSICFAGSVLVDGAESMNWRPCVPGG